MAWQGLRNLSDEPFKISAKFNESNSTTEIQQSLLVFIEKVQETLSWETKSMAQILARFLIKLSCTQATPTSPPCPGLTLFISVRCRWEQGGLVASLFSGISVSIVTCFQPFINFFPLLFFFNLEATLKCFQGTRQLVFTTLLIEFIAFSLPLPHPPPKSDGNLLAMI